ncbi:tRNA (mnm(5)s(2)U34)-methyltransferase [Geosporobacter ferrireducens]|uniref:16S rRNA (Cytosine(1402)-N(4))-methyltransferase n=1 Tax=Geosporobacter ferrireducens TaxID=1424294 RepID=A0A1D8GB23_9FIRM|nr:class I SAM-dependent methyltransferase [Geosporobacter ferrireducens]AOT68117.1 hypothetical protein Gferi_00095 [Geosporobacter ferrireducens]MTI54163.1 methyltransferase domain-containing protein [Geosporobacter ferrireducens]
MSAGHLIKATHLAKNFISSVLKAGDVAVDATMGNGNDTIFMAELVGDTGKVYAFDIQQKALDETKIKLSNQSLLHRTELIHAGHEDMDQYVKTEAAAIMFNLGYLPKGDHHIVTRAQTTIRAIEKGLSLLKTNGLLTITIYHGHPEGLDEKEAVLSYVKNLDQKLFNVLYMEFINQANNPPLLVAAEKK